MAQRKIIFPRKKYSENNISSKKLRKIKFYSSTFGETLNHIDRYYASLRRGNCVQWIAINLYINTKNTFGSERYRLSVPPFFAVSAFCFLNFPKKGGPPPSLKFNQSNDQSKKVVTWKEDFSFRKKIFYLDFRKSSEKFRKKIYFRWKKLFYQNWKILVTIEEPGFAESLLCKL